MYINTVQHKVQFVDFRIFVSIIINDGRECYFGR